jgi:hypothetical protein
MRRWATIAAAFLAIGALSGVAAYERAGSVAGGWHEIAWPFPRDGWPAGRAFRCADKSCSGDIEIYIRPKLGFCNCDRGVADDDEVDRVADLDLLSERFVPRESGRVVHVAEMAGRLRSYDLRMADGSPRTAIGIAVSRRCDLLVAVAQGPGEAARVQHAAMAFLASAEVKRWMMSALNGS